MPTTTDALAKWESRIEERERQLSEKEHQLSMRRYRQTGTRAIGLNDDSTESQAAEFERLYRDLMETKGLDRRKACLVIARQHTELHNAWLTIHAHEARSKDGLQ